MEDIEFKNKVFSNKIFLGQLLKCDKYKLEYTKEEKEMFKEMLVDRKVNISQEVLREIVSYYFVKGELREEVREYIKNRPFLYVTARKLN